MSVLSNMREWSQTNQSRKTSKQPKFSYMYMYRYIIHHTQKVHGTLNNYVPYVSHRMFRTDQSSLLKKKQICEFSVSHEVWIEKKSRFQLRMLTTYSHKVRRCTRIGRSCIEYSYFPLCRVVGPRHYPCNAHKFNVQTT